MASLFDKDPGAKPELATYGIERIESEIAHLRKPQSTRSKTVEKYVLGWWTVTLAVLVLLTLYFLDPILHAYQKGNAIKAYLYLHNYGGAAQLQALTASGILSKEEISVLDARPGSYQDYFSGPQAAQQSADAIVAYSNGVKNLQAGNYDRLDSLNKVRYDLFLKWGIPMPTDWSFLNPAVK